MSPPPKDKILNQIINALKKDEFALSEDLFFNIFVERWNEKLKTGEGSKLNISTLPSDLNIPLLNALSKTELNIKCQDFEALKQAILNVAKLAYVDEFNRILPLPIYVKDLNVDADFFNSFLRGSLSFSPLLLQCVDTQTQVLLELKKWHFYSASHLVDEKGFFAYRLNKFGGLNHDFIHKDVFLSHSEKLNTPLKPR